MSADCVMRCRGRQRLVRGPEVESYRAAGWELDPAAVQPEPPAKPKRKAPAKRKATKPKA